MIDNKVDIIWSPLLTDEKEKELNKFFYSSCTHLIAIITAIEGQEHVRLLLLWDDLGKVNLAYCQLFSEMAKEETKITGTSAIIFKGRREGVSPHRGT